MARQSTGSVRARAPSGGPATGISVAKERCAITLPVHAAMFCCLLYTHHGVVTIAHRRLLRRLHSISLRQLRASRKAKAEARQAASKEEQAASKADQVGANRQRRERLSSGRLIPGKSAGSEQGTSACGAAGPHDRTCGGSAAYRVHSTGMFCNNATCKGKPSACDANRCRGDSACLSAGGSGSFAVEGQSCQRTAADSTDSEPDAYFDRQVHQPLPSHLVGENRVLAESIQASILNVNPNVRWDAVAGLADAKRLLKEAVVHPIKYPQLFQGLLAPWKGVLMYGPPGVSDAAQRRRHCARAHHQGFDGAGMAASAYRLAANATVLCGAYA